MVLLEAWTLRIALLQLMGPHVRAYSVFPASADFAAVQTIVSFSCISETSDESLKKLHKLSYVTFAKYSPGKHKYAKKKHVIYHGLTCVCRASV